ncbi:MAG: hypothetical protein WKG07_20950 [Hymenobacter sp.]
MDDVEADHPASGVGGFFASRVATLRIAALPNSRKQRAADQETDPMIEARGDGRAPCVAPREFAEQ